LTHPDDESFAVGGTLAKYAVQEVNVDLILTTRGEAGIPGKRSWEAAEIREGELRKACLNLGVRTLDFLGFPDGQLTEVPDEKPISRLSKKCDAHTPTW
jgi:LmbE family N-acetylglucosaminyl deacetylase